MNFLNETFSETGIPTLIEGTPSTSQEIIDPNDSKILQILQGSSSTLVPTEIEETTPFNGTALEETIHKMVNLFDTHHWLIWVFLIVLFLIVVGVVVLIVVCLIKHKKRVILSRGSDQNLVEQYDQGGSFTRLCCRRKRDENKELVRQNSASNMDPYRRAPLPPIPARQGLERDEKHDSGVYTLGSNKNFDSNNHPQTKVAFNSMSKKSDFVSV